MRRLFTKTSFETEVRATWKWPIIQRSYSRNYLGSHFEQSYNHGQKFWDKFALLALLRTRQTRIQLPLPNLAPHPTYNVENQYLQFHLIFNIVLGGKRGQQRVLKGYSSVLFKLRFLNTDNSLHYTSFSRGLLSIIVTYTIKRFCF